MFNPYIGLGKRFRYGVLLHNKDIRSSIIDDPGRSFLRPNTAEHCHVDGCAVEPVPKIPRGKAYAYCLASDPERGGESSTLLSFL